MKNKLSVIILFFSVAFFTSCNNSSTTDKTTSMDSTNTTKTAMIKEEPVTYTIGGKTFKGYVTFDSAVTGKRPAVLVVPEWWGLTDYPCSRAKQLAELGYIALSVDMYGDGKIADNPKTAQEYATPFYKDPTLAKTYLDAAIKKIKEYPETDSSKIAAIGYCYGGFIVLNAAKLGADLKGVVSFHGGLGGVAPNKDLIKAKILVCHGAADSFVNPDLPAFKKSMDSAKVAYDFKEYANATHAFTNPAATENGKKFNMPIQYNEAADNASWSDMKDFFKKIF